MVPELVYVNTRLVMAPALMEAAANVLATLALETVRVALAVAPVSNVGPVAVGVVVVLLLVEVAVTLCVIVQVPPGTIVPALNPTLVPPFAPPVNVAEPAPEHATLPAAALMRVPPYGSLMVTPVRLAGLATGLVTVMTMLDAPPKPMLDGVNDFVTVGTAKTFNVWAATVLIMLPVVLVTCALALT